MTKYNRCFITGTICDDDCALYVTHDYKHIQNESHCSLNMRWIAEAINRGIRGSTER